MGYKENKTIWSCLWGARLHITEETKPWGHVTQMKFNGRWRRWKGLHWHPLASSSHQIHHMRKKTSANSHFCPLRETKATLFPRERVTENYSFSCKILTTKSVFWRDAFLGHMQTCLQKKLYLVRNNYKLSARVKTLPMWIWNFRTSVVNERNLIHISLPLLVILYSRSYTDIEDWGFTWNLSRVN